MAFRFASDMTWIAYFVLKGTETNLCSEFHFCCIVMIRCSDWADLTVTSYFGTTQGAAPACACSKLNCIVKKIRPSVNVMVKFHLNYLLHMLGD